VSSPSGQNLSAALANYKAQQAEINKVAASLTAMGVSAKLAGQIFSDAMKLSADAAKAAGAAIKEQQDRIAKGYEQVQKAAQAGFDQINNVLQKGVLVLGGYVAAGLAASSMGQVLGFQLELLSRTIAGLFAPELMKGISLIQQLTTWLQNLSDENKASVAHWLEGAAAAFAAGIAFTKVTAIIGVVISGVKALATAIVTGLASTGIGALLPLLGLLVQGFTALVVGTEGGRNALSALWEAFKPIGKVIGEVVSMVGGVLGDVFKEIGNIFKSLMPLLAPVLDFFVKMARVIVSIVLAPLKALAAVLGWVARGIASITGIKLDEAKPAEGSRGPLAPRSGGIEGIEKQWERFATAAVGMTMGKTPQEITNEKLDEVKTAVHGTTAAVREAKSGTVK
jgi:hypothetical protein